MYYCIGNLFIWKGLYPWVLPTRLPSLQNANYSISINLVIGKLRILVIIDFISFYYWYQYFYEYNIIFKYLHLMIMVTHYMHEPVWSWVVIMPESSGVISIQTCLDSLTILNSSKHVEFLLIFMDQWIVYLRQPHIDHVQLICQ
jgi:hypothetical protein